MQIKAKYETKKLGKRENTLQQGKKLDRQINGGK